MDLTVGDLVQRFDNGEIRLPIMQRDYIWKPKKVVDLLDSLYRSWPIGSFYVWQTQEDQPTRQRAGRALPQRRMDGFYGFLLDGQQRLTSLSLAVRSHADGSLSERAFFDLENEKFYLGTMRKTIAKRIEAEDPLVVPLSEIISGPRDDEAQLLKRIEPIIQTLREQKKLGKGGRDESTYRARLHTLGTLFKHTALCEEFPDEDEEHAFQLFRRLNKGGTSLSAGDVEAATAANYAILSQADNAELGDRDPFDVWRTLKPNQREWASQQLCFIGKDDLLKREAYDEFIDFRSEKIAEQLNEFLGLKI